MIPKPTVKPKNTFKNSTSCLLRPDFALEKVRLIRMIATIKKAMIRAALIIVKTISTIVMTLSCFLLILCCQSVFCFMSVFYLALLLELFLSHSPYKGIAKEKEPEHNREQGKSAYSLGYFNLAESAIHCDGYKHQHINCDTDKIINC